MGARRACPLAVLCLGLCVSAAHALHQESPGAVRLTSGTPHQASPGRAWGNWVAFASREDLVGLGGARAPGSQVFVFNQSYYDCAQGSTLPATPCPPAGTPFLVQVTNGPGDPDHPSVSKPPLDSTTEFDVWVAFDALGAFNGNTGAAAARRQIFMKHLASSELRQATVAGDGDSVRPSLSSLGQVVVFESTAMLTGLPNLAAVSQVFLYERPENVMRQLSLGPPPGSIVPMGPSTNAMPSENGTGVAFESTANLLGDGAETGVAQIFWAEYDKRTHTSTLRQLTAGDAPSRNPFVGDGPKVVVFDSEATNLPGTSTLPGRQIYQIAITTPPPTTVDQLTQSDLFGECSVPAIDPSGTRLAFVCTGDPLQNATGGPRLFVLDQTTTMLYQLTGVGTVTGRLQANVGQWFVTVATSSDLTGSGACASQLYVVDYFPGHWNAATLLGQFPPDVTGANPCAGTCTSAADCDDGNPCTGVETCGPLHFCVRGTPIVCSDNDVCNGIETCSPATGTCVGGTPLSCDDANPCTADACHPSLGCVAPPNTAPCDDGDPCTLADACRNGTCAGEAVPCPICERCDPTSAACVVGPRPHCGSAVGVRSSLRMRKPLVPAGEILAWKWRGTAASPVEFGDPLTRDAYALCLFDGTHALTLRTDAYAGMSCGTGSCWRPKPGGFVYADSTGTPTGLTQLTLKTMPGGAMKLAAKGRGVNLGLPDLALPPLPVRVQLQSSSGACWEAAYGSSATQRDATQFKVKLP